MHIIEKLLYCPIDNMIGTLDIAFNILKSPSRAGSRQPLMTVYPNFTQNSFLWSHIPARDGPVPPFWIIKYEWKFKGRSSREALFFFSAPMPLFPLLPFPLLLSKNMDVLTRDTAAVWWIRNADKPGSLVTSSFSSLRCYFLGQGYQRSPVTILSSCIHLVSHPPASHIWISALISWLIWFQSLPTPLHGGYDGHANLTYRVLK